MLAKLFPVKRDPKIVFYYVYTGLSKGGIQQVEQLYVWHQWWQKEKLKNNTDKQHIAQTDNT